jgi:hypothetical protein
MKPTGSSASLCSRDVRLGKTGVLRHHVSSQGSSYLSPVLQRLASSVTDERSVSNRKVMLETLLDYSRKQFNGRPHHLTSSKEGRDQLRDLLMTIYSNRPSAFPSVDANDANDATSTSNITDESTLRSDLLLLGIMASDVRLAMRGFRDWCQALELEYVLPDNRVPGSTSLSEVQGSVYLKYNSVSKACYLSPYIGQERGVLLQLGQDRLLGHFPLGLWDEDQSNPPPEF